MKKASKEDILFAVGHILGYIREMSDEAFEEFLDGQRLSTAFLIPEWSATCCKDYTKRLSRLELKYY